MVDVQETFKIVRVLQEAEFFDLSARVTRIHYDTAAWLLKRGIDSNGVRLLWLYAKKVSNSNPNGLFAFWLGSPSRCEKKIREALSKPSFVQEAKEHMRIEDAPGEAAPIHNIRRREA